MAGAVSARDLGWAAAFHNPASLASLERSEFAIGLVGFGGRLRVGDQPRPIDEPMVVLNGAAAKLPFGSFLRDRVYVGIALELLPDALAHVIVRAPDEAMFPYYDNRTQRLVLLPTLALRLPLGLSVGVAVNYFAGLRGQVLASEGATRAVEARVDERLPAVARVNVGLRWRARDAKWSAALVYRQRFSVPVDTQAQSQVAGQPLDVAVRADALFTPDEVVLGGMARPLPWLSLSVDLGASLWSRWQGPFLRVNSELPIVGAIGAPPPALRFRDTYSARLGLEGRKEFRGDLGLRVRAGYAFESAMVDGGTNDAAAGTRMLDGAKHLAALGLGVRFGGEKMAVRLDGHAQLQVVQGAVAGQGGERVSGGGLVYSAGWLLTVEQ